jgi:hypothetical protein
VNATADRPERPHAGPVAAPLAARAEPVTLPKCSQRHAFRPQVTKNSARHGLDLPGLRWQGACPDRDSLQNREKPSIPAVEVHGQCRLFDQICRSITNLALFQDRQSTAFKNGWDGRKCKGRDESGGAAHCRSFLELSLQFLPLMHEIPKFPHE